MREPARLGLDHCQLPALPQDGRLNHSARSLRLEPHVVFIYNKLVKNETGGKNMENSFMTHQDDREDYSVVQAKTALAGFFLKQSLPLRGKCV